VVHDDGAEMAHDEGVDTAAAAGQKHARLHNTRPQGTSNIRPQRDSNHVQTTITSSNIPSLMGHLLYVSLHSGRTTPSRSTIATFFIDIFCSYCWNLAPLPLSLPNTGKKREEKTRKGRGPFMAVLAFKVTATAKKSMVFLFMFHVIHPRAQNF
jgi:hypothetical protein